MPHNKIPLLREGDFCMVKIVFRSLFHKNRIVAEHINVDSCNNPILSQRPL